MLIMVISEVVNLDGACGCFIPNEQSDQSRQKGDEEETEEPRGTLWMVFSEDAAGGDTTLITSAGPHRSVSLVKIRFFFMLLHYFLISVCVN